VIGSEGKKAVVFRLEPTTWGGTATNILSPITIRTILATAVCSGLLVSYEGSAQESNAAAIAEMSQPQFNFLGFGDISYITRDADDPGGFAVGQAVAQVSASLDDSLSIFGEFSLTANDSSQNAAIERMIVKYSFSDLFKLSAGRYHSPIGYWNSAFHHGAWLQTTVSRPQVYRFGSQIVPIHFAGALIEGTWAKNSLGLSYMAGFGNGRHENISQPGDAGDINGDNAWMVQLSARPAKLYGLNAGLGFYTDKISQDNEPEINEKTTSAYVVWAKESPEILLEYLYSTHDLVNDSSVSGDVNSWYAQFAYRLKGKHRNWKPYARYEYTKVDDSDPLLGDQGLNYEAGILGVRWDFNPHAALKGEYRNEEYDDSGRENNFRVQVSFVLSKL